LLAFSHCHGSKQQSKVSEFSIVSFGDTANVRAGSSLNDDILFTAKKPGRAEFVPAIPSNPMKTGSEYWFQLKLDNPTSNAAMVMSGVTFVPL